MVTKHVGTTTGPNKTTQLGVNGTDLGYLTKTNHGYVIGLFGDTSDGAFPGEPGWRSPVALRTSNTDLDNGIKWDNAMGGSRAKQLVPYRRDTNPATNNENAPFTVIPNDMVHLPDGTYLMSTHHVKSWDRNGRFAWQTFCNRFYKSTQRDAEDWQATDWADLAGNGPVQFNNDGGAWRVFQNASLVVDGDYLYMFGTESGRARDGGIYLARVPWREWDRLWSWKFWGWTGQRWEWGAPVPTPILQPSLPSGTIGEINARVIDGVWYLSYMEFGGGDSLSWGAAVTRASDRPDGVWTAPQVHLTSWDSPNPYAPALHPYSTKEKAYLHLSQWTGGQFYGCHLFRLDQLHNAGPDDGLPDLRALPFASKNKAAEMFGRGDLRLTAAIRMKAGL